MNDGAHTIFLAVARGSQQARDGGNTDTPAYPVHASRSRSARLLIRLQCDPRQRHRERETSELRSFTDDIQMILVSVSCLKTRAAKEQRVVAYTRKSVISDELMCVRAVQRAEWLSGVCVRAQL